MCWIGTIEVFQPTYSLPFLEIDLDPSGMKPPTESVPQADSQTETAQQPRKGLIEPRTLKGFRDILPRDAITKRRMVHSLSEVFGSFGFVPIETPHLEYTECLFGEAGPEIQKQVYRFKDNGDRDVALRFDLTVPFARFVAQHRNEIGLPFKRWVVGEAFRGENTQAGRYREFTQCDFDFVGTDSLSADAEIIQVIDRALRTLGVGEFTIQINNRKVMSGLLAALGYAEKVSSILIELDKLDKVGEERVRASLISGCGVSPEAAEELLSFVQLSSGNASTSETLGRLSPYRGRHELLASGIAELETVTRLVEAVGVPEATVRIDLSIARGLGYYTGIIYETRLTACPGIGSVCSGGRYDNLTQTFMRERCPGVGASIGLDRLMAALEQLGLLPTTSTSARVLIAVPSPELSERALTVGAQLRNSGIPTEVYPDAHKMKRQVEYAKRAGHPYLLTFQREGVGMVLERVADGVRTECAEIASVVKALS